MLKSDIDRRIKFLIIMMVILLVVIISLMLLISLNSNQIATNTSSNSQTQTETTNLVNQLSESNKDGTYENIIFSNEIDNNVKYVENSSDYFTVSSLVNNYIEIIGNQNKTKLNAILSPNYISSYKITNNNIFEKLKIPALDNNWQYYKFRVSSMLTSQIDETTQVYIVTGNCRIVGKNTLFSIKVMIELDTVSKLYNIYPYQYIQDNNIDKIKVGEKLTNYHKEEILNRDLNKFTYITMADKELANKYFEDFKEMILYYPEEAYNKLNSEYSQKRFGSQEDFKIYLDDNAETLSTMSIKDYKVSSYNNNTDYICSDQYNNIYIFRQYGGIMRYTMFLDNYTIMMKDDVEYYNKLDKFDKGKYNLTRFINMVNTKDYKAIYNVLDTTFRTNNFKKVENLRKYINDNLYNINSLEIADYDDETYAYYVFNCRITNKKNTNETKNMTIIINQTEGIDFTMSFSF